MGTSRFAKLLGALVVGALLAAGATTYAIVNYPPAAGLGIGSVQSKHILNNTIENADIATSTGFVMQSLGLASTSPWGQLSVEMGSTTPAFVVADKGTSTPAFQVDGRGFIQVGISDPSRADGFLINRSVNINSTNTLNFGGASGGHARFYITGASTGTLIFDQYSGTVFREGFRVVNTSGYMGLASTSPWGRLSVSGTSLSSDPAFVVSTSTAVGTTTAFIVGGNGKVGVGTTSPSYENSTVGKVYATQGFVFPSGIVQTAAGAYRLNSTTTATDITNGGLAETTLFSAEVPAYALATTSAVYIKVAVTDLDFGGTSALTLRMRYGETNCAVTGTVTPGTVVNNQTGYIEGMLVANGSATSQDCSLQLASGTSGYNTERNHFYGSGTASENSANSRNITISADWDTAAGSITAGHGSAVIEP